MSVLRQAQPIRPIAPRRHLRPVPNKVQPVKRVASSAKSEASFLSILLSKKVVRKLLIGLTSIAVAGLCVNALCDQAVYRIAELKSDTAALATQSQIIGQQVDSLRSPQNLSNSAKALGMIVNSNPVFLKIREAKVLDSAVPASASESSAVSANLIANAAMTHTSDTSALASVKQATIDAPKVKTTSNQSVKSAKSGTSKVALERAEIPASPTN